MKKCHLTIYNSALLLLLLVQYSESCNDICNHTQEKSETPIPAAKNLVEMFLQMKRNIFDNFFKSSADPKNPNAGKDSSTLPAAKNSVAAGVGKPSSVASKNESNSDTHDDMMAADAPYVEENPVVGYQSVGASEESVCQFSTKIPEGSNPLPLLLTPDSSPEFMYPDAGSDVIKLKEKEKIRFACPGAKNFIKTISGAIYTQVASAECKGNNLFAFGKESYSIDKIVCELAPMSVARRTAKECLSKVPENTAKYVEIGFELNSKEFVKTIDVCWENATKTTFWVENKITRVAGVQRVRSFSRMDDAIFYDAFDVIDQYFRDEQRKTIKAVTKSDSLANKYINVTDGLLLTKGRFAHQFDFFYAAAQSSADWSINSAPQWSRFQYGNCRSLANSIREFVETKSHPLIIYTGTHGQMFLDIQESKNDKSPISVPFYLYVDANDPKKNGLPVPKYFWKIVYDPVTKTRIAFVTVNDPWATPDNAGVKEYCQDNPPKPEWLIWEPENAQRGLSYICNVDELRELIPTLPYDDSDKSTCLGTKWIGYKSVEPSNENICQFSIDAQKDSDPLPLLLTPGSSPGFIYPDAGSNIIKLLKTKKIRLACPGPENSIPIISRVNMEREADIEAECIGGNLFMFQEKSFSIEEITCQFEPVSSTNRQSVKEKCLPYISPKPSELVEIGFKLNSEEFLKTIDICWDHENDITYWAKFNMTKSTETGQHWNKREEMKGDSIYGSLDVDKSYTICQQRSTMEVLMDSTELVGSYINEGDNKNVESMLYITEGQFARRNSFFYHPEQMSTYWYINQVPQWYSFCYGNWQSLESSINKFLADNKDSPLVIYTGTHEQMSLKDLKNPKTTKRVPFYLYADYENPEQNNALPVPKYFWKILYNSSNQKAIAFIGVNDPWATTDSAGVESYCDSIPEPTWLRWVPDNSKLGLCYICMVNDKLRNWISTLPELNVTGVLR